MRNSKSAVQESQRAIVDAIEGGAAGNEGPLRRVDTHMSHIFLGRDHVYKLKRSVRHPFGDMSSVEARRVACEAELEVNRLLAPDLYRRVLPITRDAGGDLRIGGEGRIEDWVVEMRRFPDGALFSELADKGALTSELIAEAATTIARFHARLGPLRRTGHAVDYRRIVEGLRQTEAEGAAALGIAPASQPLFEALERTISHLSPLLEARRESGSVRRGHGDLHLQNICVFEGRVTPFDALEFDPALSSADVLYDLAFLLMDLRARGLSGLANVAMNTYWDATGEAEAALSLLPLFMALRAAVRMAVATEAGNLVEADSYRALGRSLLAPSSPQLLAIGGLSGSGKSTLARAVAHELPGCCGARILRTDVIRKHMAGAMLHERLAEDSYHFAARVSVYDAVANRAREALCAGTSVVADATYREAPFRAAIESASQGYPFQGMWLSAPPEVRAARIAHRQGDASDATVEVALNQVEPQSLGSWSKLDGDHPLPALVEAARRRVMQG